MRMGMLIELDRCVGCMACVSACKERWDSGPSAARDWVHTIEHGTRGKDLGVTFYPGLCMQCDGHPCTTECPTGATYARDDGIVVVDKDLCIGCGNCIPMCPYGARHVDQEKKIVEKCNLCAPYMARGEKPACVATCLAECRHVGDLSDSASNVSQLIRERKALPLITTEVNVGPNVYYAPADYRDVILSKGAVKQPQSAGLTRAWDQLSRPLARLGVPSVAAIAALGGLVVNFRSRGSKDHVASLNQAPYAALQAKLPDQLPRHRLGMRFLHWYNLLSWILLLGSGTALMATPKFALFGTAMPKAIASLAGGAANLLRLHAGWGLLWALIIVPFFLMFKKGGIEALKEIRLTQDDIRWLLIKPFAAMGMTSKPLPRQDKYNAGQKAFATSALVGTATIIVSGLVMTFHLGPAGLMSAMILVHKMAIAIALMGLAVHVTMAALVKDERPALSSMITGKVKREHAVLHATNWAEELSEEDHSEHRSGQDG